MSSCNIFLKANKIIETLLLFLLFFLYVEFCSYGADNVIIVKDEKFQELCKKIDSALLERDYSTARKVLDQMAPYEPCLSYYEKRFQFVTDIFLCIQEEDYDAALLKHERFFKSNLKEIEQESDNEVALLFYIGIWLYFVNQDHREIGDYLANHALSFYEKWMVEQKEDYKIIDASSLRYKTLAYEIAFVFYSSQHNDKGVQRSFSLIQNFSSFFDLHYWITHDYESVSIYFAGYESIYFSEKQNTPLVLKIIKPGNKMEAAPFMENGCVHVPLLLEGVIEEDYPIKEIRDIFVGLRLNYKRKWQ